MKQKLLNGDYYEFYGIYLDTFKMRSMSDITKKEAINYACNSENELYVTTYKEGELVKIIALVGNKNLINYPRVKGNIYYEELPDDMKYRYAMLGRLKSDCDYALNYGKGSLRHLWAGNGNIDGQIEEMRKRWNEFAFDERPEWLTMDQINEYERKLKELESEV